VLILYLQIKIGLVEAARMGREVGSIFDGPRRFDLRVLLAFAVFACVPFALVGGIVALALRSMAFSIPAAVGMIALCGIAVLNGVVMASAIQRRIFEGESLNNAIADGASEVLRPLLLTASVAALGFLPMALSSSAGSEVQRPLATVVIGGLLSSTLLGALLLPAVLRLFLRERPGDEAVC
jgi:cobalt-zinc-cadmium resistance protein CzcA